MNNLPRIARDELVRVMAKTREVEMQYAPVATGSLRDSSRVIMTGQTSGMVRIGGGTRRGTGEPIDYTIFQEYGTIHNAAHPFARPAADYAATQIGSMPDISGALVS
jgi:HK97 gp10 family phage protein